MTKKLTKWRRRKTKPERKQRTKGKASKKENTKIKEDKKCTTKIHNSLPKYKRIEIKGRFCTGTSRWLSTKLTVPSRNPYAGGRRNNKPGYETIYRNYKTWNSGGIMIAVKDTLKTITMQVKQKTEVGRHYGYY